MRKYIASILIAGVFTYYFRDLAIKFNYNNYKETLSALINISSIIFAIIGAWIAIIYPKSLERVSSRLATGSDLFEANVDTNYLSKLVEIVLVSAIVLLIVLSAQFLAPFFSEIKDIEIKNPLKYFSFFCITFLTISQSLVILRVILINYIFLDKLRKVTLKAKTDSLMK
ncbi:hypothetical protein [Laribacter hongkongensis]|uniref:hypothetical protein n=1 Tax=Laribacter hongkongensis TaxID=168471 RepID=UPI000B59F88B|nr:hypothetical protein [Laribacter hongkongensis]MCG9042013.1 hypothetical protein [Laribacter hongkongensis]MCG9068983.1 hypothetical protein [Laribacter hongkongensis]MCG9079932.1 hypothetical protein [Laribacter hongkongensis]MCG9087735.1 hypothetical protein [Laribacter hongkongensis]MCG9110850.1 hypothetical protein [Laribacter hongkongensis]